ncbi:hypothetical protein ACI2LJ_27645 [Streptomyces sp. NPDC088090]|uniref:hypothetical protein n=1 Tax=Streptomyces sp. NPDC088090 TaxID=3365822 RepID=UPI00384D318C
MTPAQRLAGARAHLDRPPTPVVPGQTAIPLAALAVIDAAEEDATDLHETDHDRATRVALYLATAGWTITPAQENPHA